MRILIFHGYLLEGTGSNVYTARLTEALLALGHDVHLLAQDRTADRLPFVDAVGSWDSGRLQVRRLRRRSPSCTVYRPNIGTLLPVYVEDRYEGFEARAFVRCSEAELHSYIESNLAALAEVRELARPDLALANHLVMGPAIVARALAGAVPYVVKVHGSALEYTVKRDPGRFVSYAREGVIGAERILVGSSHTAQSLWRALGEEWSCEHRIPARTTLGPPGVDVQAFRPRARARALQRLQALSERLRAAGEAAGPPAGDRDAFARDQAEAGSALAALSSGSAPIVAYVGKLIVSKGVDLLLAAWPLVLEAMPEARLAIVGFGSFRAGLQRLLEAIASGDIEAAIGLARAGRALEGATEGPLSHLLTFLASLEGEKLRRYCAAGLLLPQRVMFTGRLEHEELCELLPCCEAVVVPSTFPEAFGMVAAEAAACGALPISASHSGLAEVSASLSEELPADVRPLLSFEIGDQVVERIAEHVVGWLRLDDATRQLAKRRCAEAVRARWSWERVARDLIAAAAEGIALAGADRASSKR